MPAATPKRLALRFSGWLEAAPEPRLERLRAAVRARERQSERLISYVQLGIALFFLLLYLAAPRPVDSPAAGPVPFAIGIFLLAVLVRIALGATGRLSGPVLALSMVVDIAVLCGLVWSFHIQYGQPAAFSLKAPTFAYLFVLIALRALRFDARYVVTIGVLAALGWTALTLLALLDGGSEAVTRSFSDYIASSDRILIGAEVDKIVALLLVTAILAVAIRRGRAILVRAVTEEAGVSEIRRFLAPGVAEAITEAEEPVEVGHAEERDAAILVLDLRGFSRFAAGRNPRQVVAFLVGFHERIAPIVERHGGVIDKYLGDGVMATFGVVRRSETPAADAMRALDDILVAAADWEGSFDAEAGGEAPCVNAAVADGRVVFAALGHAGRLEYTVIGEAVNLAAKLEKHNKEEGTAALVPLDSFERAVAEGYRPPRKPGPLRSCAVSGIDGRLLLVPISVADDGRPNSASTPGQHTAG